MSAIDITRLNDEQLADLAAAALRELPDAAAETVVADFILENGVDIDGLLES